MRILLTGGTGLLGRAVLARLARGHEVLAITRRQPVEIEGARWIEHDLTAPQLPDVLPESIDAVVHLAQSERYRDFPDGAEDVFAVNVASTFRLLEYARRASASHFVLASTGGVYRPQPEPIGEESPLELDSPYFRSKRIAELLLGGYEPFFLTAALRFFFIYGPGGGQALIPRLAGRILAGEEIAIEGDPGLRFNPIFVDDAAEAVEAALRLDRHAIVNVAGKEVVDLADLVARLGAALDRDPAVRHGSPGPEGDLIGATTAMRELLGVSPGHDLERGLSAVANATAVRSGS